MIEVKMLLMQIGPLLSAAMSIRPHARRTDTVKIHSRLWASRCPPSAALEMRR